MHRSSSSSTTKKKNPYSASSTTSKTKNQTSSSSSSTPKLPPINDKKSKSSISSSSAAFSSSSSLSKSKVLTTPQQQQLQPAAGSSSSVSKTQSVLKQRMFKHYQAFSTEDKRPALTLELGNEENSVFASLADLLFRNNNADKNNNNSGKTESKWIQSRVKVSSSTASSTISTHNSKSGNPFATTDSSKNPCCIQLSGINLYLGVKTVTERLVTEAGIVCNRVRRNGGHMPVCLHMSRKDQISDDEYTSYPNRILVAFFPGTKPITLKANMTKSLCDYFGSSFTFSHITPESYVVTPRKEIVVDNFSGGNTALSTTLSDQRGQWLKAIQYRKEQQQQQEQDQINNSNDGSNNKENAIWIAKSSHGAKGRGLKIIDTSSASSSSSAATATTSGGNSQQYFSNLALDPSVFLTQFDRNLDSNPWVIQKYIERPLLYRGRKFDLRAWVLLTPRLEIFLYKEGVCRLCTEEYDNTNFNNEYQHLSNNCLQEKHANFGKFEKGNLLSFDEMNDRLFSKMKRSEVVGNKPRKFSPTIPSKFLFPPSSSSSSSAASTASLTPLSTAESPHQFMSYKDDVLPQMKRIIGNCFSSIKTQILPVYDAGAIDCFQYFGFDFMLDESMKLILLEVNGAAGVADYLLQPTVEDLAETVIYDMLPQSKPPVINRARRDRPNWFEKILGKDEW